MSKHKTAVLVVFLLSLAVLAILPFGQGAVWDGSFPLTVALEYDAAALSEHVRFSLCFNDAEKKELDRTNSSKVELDYLDVKSATEGAQVLTIPCSGRGGYFGIGSSRYQPSYLVIEYGLVGHPRRWKIVPIPTAPTQRTMEVSLP